MENCFYLVYDFVCLTVSYGQVSVQFSNNLYESLKLSENCRKFNIETNQK